MATRDPLHVGLNLVFLVPGETGGMEIYARELLRHLAGTPGLRLTAFVNKEAAGSEWAPEVQEVVVPVRARRRAEWVFGEQWHVPRLARSAGCHLLHSLGSTAPLWGHCPRVTTIHDLNYMLVPEAHFGLRRLGMAALVPASARRAHRIVVDAHSTAADLQNRLGVKPGKIDVVPLGVRREPPEETTSEAQLRVDLDLGDRQVLLSVSARRPHKNLIRLLEAHARFEPSSRPMLVIPGYPTPHERDLITRARELQTLDQVRFPAWLGQADLEGLYAIAQAFVFPSLYEGFGLPVLEAMRRGVPVGCSDRASLPEVAGDAALLFDPESVEAIHDSLRRLLEDENLRSRLSAAGPAQADRFDWQTTAELTHAVYRGVSDRAADGDSGMPGDSALLR